MKVLYVQPHSEMEVSGERLIITHPDKTPELIELEEVEAILTFGIVLIDAYTQHELLRHQIPVSLFDRHGIFLGRMEPAQLKRAGVIRAQALMSEEQRLYLMSQIICCSLHQRRRFLQRSVREHEVDIKDQFQALEFAIRPFKWNTLKPDVEYIRGLQGSGFKAYWDAFPQILQKSFPFEGRSRGGAVNRMLDFAYELTNQSCLNAISATGLDPWLGIFHSDYERQVAPPLALDLATEFRIYSEAVVTRCINRGQVALKDIDNPDELPAHATKTIATSYERKLNETFTHPLTRTKTTYQEAIYLQARQIKGYLEGFQQNYVPLLLK